MMNYLVSILFSIFCLLGSYTLSQAQVESKIHSFDITSGDRFSYAMDTDGDRILVGSYLADPLGNVSGAAYVLDWNGSSYTQTKILAYEGGGGDKFGKSCAVKGDTLLIGAPEDWDVLVTEDRGSVYLAIWDGSQYQQTKFVPSDIADDDEFGSAVALGEGIFVASSPNNDTPVDDIGAIYIFEWTGSSWTETKIVPSDGGVNDFFGRSVDMYNNKIIVGNMNNDNSNGNDAGAAYLYEKINGTWTETKIIASDGEIGDKFGSSVSIYEDRILVGAYGVNDNNISNTGAAYIYDWDGSNWNETKLTPINITSNSYYGYATDLYESRAIVGAYSDDINSVSTGSAFVYDLDGGTWNETKLIASDGNASDSFGYTVSIEGENTFVGAYLDDDFGSSSGTVYQYEFTAWYEDFDGDGYGNPNVQVYSDTLPSGFVANGDDCDDMNNAIGAIGTACDDGIACSSNTTIQNDCSCGGGTINSVQNTFTKPNGNWFDQTNWSLNEIPDICHDVIIPAGSDVNIPNGTIAYCYTLIVELNANLAIPQGSEIFVVAE